jgi:signal transduction histidine kinase
VEDSEADAELVVAELKRRGFMPIVHRVAAREPLIEALADSSAWDLVISDHNMPGFGGMEALALVKSIAPDLPFVVVSGTVGEDHAVEAMRGGASDFVGKMKLDRLAPVVERELREVAQRAGQRETARALEESQRQLRQSQKLEAVGRLAGGIAHDFNNLLTVVLGYTDLLLGDMPADDPRRPDVEEIRAAGTRASELTRQLLAFSRQRVLERTALDLNSVVEESVKLLRRVIGEDIRVKLDTASTLWTVMADRTQMLQVMMNLAVNARDAMPQGGTLTIETANVQVPADRMPNRPPLAGDYVTLTVRDTGLGMSADVRAHLFEPFFTTKDASKGSGLGLSMVYGIVQQSDGCVFVESELGHGAEFTIYFPRGRGADRAPADQAEPVKHKGTVLLVEDEASLRDLASRILRKAGYAVRAVAGPHEALAALAASGAVDVVLTDVVMPGMTGFALADRIHETIPSLPVLFMTGFPSESASQNRGKLLLKPFTPGDLLTRIGEALAGVSA